MNKHHAWTNGINWNHHIAIALPLRFSQGTWWQCGNYHNWSFISLSLWRGTWPKVVLMNPDVMANLLLWWHQCDNWSSSSTLCWTNVVSIIIRSFIYLESHIVHIFSLFQDGLGHLVEMCTPHHSIQSMSNHNIFSQPFSPLCVV
jgi:hypothetical protein